MNTDDKNNNEILIYSTLLCPYCHAAKQLLKSKDLDYQEIRVDQVATQFGGGGHACAAATCSDLPLRTLRDGLIEALKNKV